MTAVLPQGLINANPNVQQHALDDSDLDLTNAEVLSKFWKVYAIQSEATQDTSSTRLRNLFWRVWSSPILTQSMTSARLVHLWAQCNGDLDLTPIEDSISRPRRLVSQDFSTPNQASNTPSPLSPASEIHQTSGSTPRTRPNVAPTLQNFKFPSVTTDRGDGDSYPSLMQAGGHGRKQSEDTSGSTSHATSESSSRPTLSRTTSGGRQRLPVLATAGKSRTRPQIPRRKSSSQKSPGGPSVPKSLRGQQETAVADATTQDPGAVVGRLAARGPPPGLPMVPSTTSGPVFALPSASSWQSVDSASDNLVLATTALALPTASAELVDPDFRGKFVETQKKLVSSTNLAGLNRIKKTGSVVRFADEVPLDVRKGKEREKEAMSPLRDENIGSSRLWRSMSSDTVSDDADDDDSSLENMQLPRTKSHLSLLIQNRRDQTGSSDIGPATESRDSSGKEKEKEKAKSKEEELLSMGRRDGVTKAGGVQVPKQHRISELEDPGYMSPSSPEPLF
ncbi:uncharacterized protein A1O5_10726 [Cladophialophora psammophila CBS 110553]|uniref:Nitrogen regulatory protein areA GATA-like domain-containing protein n=1 Tax=Cladophialophora psammophila CBS 110553 TaxID=1182543 RepID=W9WN82_9EURO|nr:uncharacterized protein A1O5_10726 [Cladophialophora psammophila CBS 110553]EXJ66111.1 hypothetical protein A1O5_10726 [Cladophialophora psammophila CBS 110553]